MDITLALVCLHHEQIGHMATNMILVAGSVAAEDLLETSVAVSILCEYPGLAGR